MLRAEIRIPTASLSRCLAAKGVNSAPREVVMIQLRTACWHLVALTALTGCGSRDDALSALYGPDVSGVQGEELICAPLPPGAIAWWPGDGSAADIIGKHDGKWASFSQGLVKRGFDFEGSGEVARFPFERVEGDFSIEFWVRPDPAITPTTPEAREMFARGLDHTLGTANWGPEPDCGACNGRFEVRGPLPRPYSHVDTWGDGPHEWRHVSVTYDSGLYVVYVDGQPEPATSVSDVSVLDRTEEVTLGGIDARPSSHFIGQLDEITIYDRALGPDEVSGIYRAGSAGKCRTFKDVSR
jgi:hypothetical protein